MTAAIGELTKLGFSALNSASPITTRIDYQSESLAAREEFLNTNGLRGTRSHDIERVRQGVRRIGGTLNLQPTAVELAGLLQWILGGAPSGTTYPLADTLPFRTVAIDRNGGYFEYTGCKVARATFRASQGEPLNLALDLVGQDESTSGSFPVLSIDTTTGPFIFTDCVLSVNAVTAAAREFELTIDNRIDADRFFNSQTLTAVNPIDREIMFRTRVPYGDYTTLYNTGVGGVAVAATFTNAATSLAFSMAKVPLPRQSPTVPGREEVMLDLAGRAYRSGATLELVTVLDSTP